MPSVDARSAEPVSIVIASSGVGITGAILRYDVTRVVAGSIEWLNRTTNTFVASVPADGDRWKALAQVDAVNAPGLYEDAAGGVDLAAITNPTVPSAAAPAIYSVNYYETAPSALYLCSAEIRAGVDDNIRRQLTNAEELTSSGLGRVRADDGSIEAEYQVTDKTGGPINLQTGDPARRTAQAPP